MDIETKKKVKINAVVFLWILFCNSVVQIFFMQLSGIGFSTWAFFLINVLFFLMNDVDYKERFIRALIGSIVGLLAAGFMTFATEKLSVAGVTGVISIMMPLTVCLAVIIILHPIFPRLFNNCGFAYFVVALINSETAFVNMIPYMVSTVAGHLIVNTGTVAIIIIMSRCINKE